LLITNLREELESVTKKIELILGSMNEVLTSLGGYDSEIHTIDKDHKCFGSTHMLRPQCSSTYIRYCNTLCSLKKPACKRLTYLHELYEQTYEQKTNLEQ
jgi:hypothetical protein